MAPLPLVFFDDRDAEGVHLAPLCDLRPTCDIRTGVRTTRERWEAALGTHTVGVQVPEYLAALCRETEPDIAVNAPMPGDILLVNGRCPLPPAGAADLQPGEAIVDPSGAVVCMVIDGAHATRTPTTPPHTHTLDTPSLLTRPWSFRDFRDAAIAADLHDLAPATSPIPDGVTLIGDHAVHIAPDATVAPTAVLDATHGRIYLGPCATVQPQAMLVGPCAIGAGSTVLAKALMKANTSIGPVCKVAGEVGGTIIQGYSNKGHDGHLGDAWLGEWVNLGAGTTNSNLLNTYGNISAAATPGGEREPTGHTFLGCVLGDHVKAAICTRIMTGSIVHTGAMWAASAPITGCVRPFAWVTDAGEQSYRADKFIETARAVMGRRNLSLSEACAARLHGLMP